MGRVAGRTKTLPNRAMNKTRVLDFRGFLFMTTKTKLGLLRSLPEKFFEIGGMGVVTARATSFDDRFVGELRNGDLRHLIGILLPVPVTAETECEWVLL